MAVLTIEVPHKFFVNKGANADKVNENFDALESGINTAIAEINSQDTAKLNTDLSNLSEAGQELFDAKYNITYLPDDTNFDDIPKEDGVYIVKATQGTNINQPTGVQGATDVVWRVEVLKQSETIVTQTSYSGVGGNGGSYPNEFKRRFISPSWEDDWSCLNVRTWISQNYSFANGTPIISTHNLNLTDLDKVTGLVYLRCLSADFGYNVGDITEPNYLNAAGQFGYMSATVGANNISTVVGSQGLTIQNKTTGANTGAISNTKWALFFKIIY